MRKLLVYTYFSENCYNAIKYAIDLSLDLEIPVRIVHYYKSPKAAGMLLSIDRRLYDDAVIEMDKLKTRLIKEYGEETLTHVEANFSHGEIFKSLNKSLKRNKSEFVILSAKDEYDSSELFLGSFAGALIRQSNMPVLIVPEHHSYKSIDKVLLAVQKPKIAQKSMLKPLKDILTHSQADLSLLTFSDKKKHAKKSSIGDHISKLKPVSIDKAAGEDIYNDTIEYLKSNQFDLLTVIRKKKGFFGKFLMSTRIDKKKFSISFPLLVLSGS